MIDMKKLLSAVLAISFVVSAMPVFANQSDEMQNVLLEVKKELWTLMILRNLIRR